jgi:transposase
MKILALDLGNFKSVGCEYDTQTTKTKYETIVSHKAAVRELLQKRRPDRVVIEICPLAGWVCDVVRELGIEIQVAGTNEQRSRWRNVKRKSDRRDALKLAQRLALGELKLVHVPERAVRQWRSLINYRQQLVRRRTKIKNHLRALLLRENLSWARGKSGWTQEAVAKLQQLALPLNEVAADELWRGELAVELEALKAVQGQLRQVEKQLDQMGKANEQVQLLRSAAGVGPRLAEALVAQFDNPRRLKHSKEVGPYLGLVPKQWQSGETERLGHITREGSRVIRALLVEASWAGLRYNPWIREVYQRIKRGSKSRRKIAIVAVARRLAVRCWAMLRDGTRWRETPQAMSA